VALGVDSRANVRELLINANKTNKQKMLTGLTQKGRDLVLGYPFPPTTAITGTGGQAAPYYPGIRAERGKPVPLPQGKASRKASRWGCE
jgi:hypothetical protein